jgi:hypothetical protein
MSRRQRGRTRTRPEQKLQSAVSTDDGLNTWLDYCGGQMFVVGYTEGGAPYGHVEWTDTGAQRSADFGRESIPNEENLEPF